MPKPQPKPSRIPQDKEKSYLNLPGLRLLPLTEFRLSLMGIRCSRRAIAETAVEETIVNFCQTAEEQIETSEARDHSRASALEGLRVSRVYCRWVKFVRLAVNIRTHRVVSRYWGQLGALHLQAGGLQIYYNWASQHWGRIGHRLQKHKRLLRTLQ